MFSNSDISMMNILNPRRLHDKKEQCCLAELWEKLDTDLLFDGKNIATQFRFSLWVNAFHGNQCSANPDFSIC